MKRLPYQPKMLAEAGHSIISKFNELADQLGLSRSLAEAAQTELSRLERAIAANWKASETGAHIAPALSRARQAAAAAHRTSGTRVGPPKIDSTDSTSVR